MYEDWRRVDEGKYSNNGLFMYDDCRRADEGNIQTAACLCTRTVEQQTRVIFRQVYYVASPGEISHFTQNENQNVSKKWVTALLVTVNASWHEVSLLSLDFKISKLWYFVWTVKVITETANKLRKLDVTFN